MTSSSKKKLIWAIIVIVVIIVIVSVTNKPKDTSTIKIGGLYVQTGPIAAVGEYEEEATKIAVDTINNNGGINGRKVEVIREDTAYDPQKALSAYNAAKLQGVRLFVADGSSPVAAVRKPVLDDGNFLIVPAATTPAYFDGDNRSCRIALTAKNFGPGLADLLAKNNYKTASFLLPANEYGKGLADEFTKAFTSKGGTIIVGEFYDATPGAGDYRTNITKIKARQSETDALVLVQVANTIEPMLTQVSDLGWAKPIVSDFYTVENPSLKNRALANGIQYVTYQYSTLPQAEDSKSVSDFKAEYFKRFNRYPIYTGAATYDSIMIIANAVAHVGEDPQKIADYVSSLTDYKAITGNLTFNSDCEVNRQISFAKVENGAIVNVK